MTNLLKLTSLCQNLECEYILDAPMKEYTTFQIGGPCDILVRPYDEGQIAVLIHACGKFISVRNSNECAYNIIMSTEIIGISHLEREIIANVVRYNIRDFDYNMVRMETELDEVTDSFSGQNEVMLLIAKLTAMLRLANSMDRGHSAKLADCRMTVKDQNLIITTDYHGDITLEAVSFEQKAAFFEEIFGIRPVLRHKKYV